MILAIFGIFLAFIYLIWPFDIIPDVIPIIGYIDDIIIVSLAVLFLMDTMKR